MLSIDEAIAQEREVAEMNRNDIVPKENYHNMPWIDMENELNMRSAEEHEQLAEWLEELKDYRDKNKMVVRIDVENMDSVKDKIEELSKYAEIQYNKAIDDFIHECDRYCGFYSGKNISLTREDILKIAEQLKERE